DITDPYTVTVDYDGTTSRLLRSLGLRMQGWTARLVLMLGPYLKYASADLGTWISEPDLASALSTRRAGEPLTVLSWSEISDVLELRLGPPGDEENQRNRGNRYARLLRGRQLGRLELAVLRQAAEELSARRTQTSAPAAVGAHTALRSVILSYLVRVDSVVTGPRLASRFVRPVLDALRPHFEGSELSETFDRNCDRILALAAANDALDSPDGPADTPVHLPEDGRGGASGHSG